MLFCHKTNVQYNKPHFSIKLILIQVKLENNSRRRALCCVTFKMGLRLKPTSFSAAKKKGGGGWVYVICDGRSEKRRKKEVLASPGP